MKTFKTTKGTELPMLDLRGKPYLQVAHRLVWFREDHPDWTIETEITPKDKACLAKATIMDQTGRVIATAHKVEDIAGFNDYIEKAETGSIGRALALCGYGTQFAPDLDEGSRIVDSPVSRATTSTPQRPTQGGPYTVGFGKHKGKSLDEMGERDVRSYLMYLLGEMTKSGKDPLPSVKAYIDEAKKYLDQKSGNNPPPPGDDLPF
jgi:hypothetical protein